MKATTSRDQLEGVPVAQLAIRPDPASWHQALRSLGTHARGGEWIVSTPPDVAAALNSAALKVIPPSAPAGPAAELVARMARFCDGDAHRRGRSLLVQLLPPVPVVARYAADQATRYVREQATGHVLDIMPLARAPGPGDRSRHGAHRASRSGSG